MIGSWTVSSQPLGRCQEKNTTLFGNPLSKKSVYFAFLALRNIFDFHQKVKILSIFLRLLLGIGVPPSPTSQIPKTPVFFSGMNKIK